MRTSGGSNQSRPTPRALTALLAFLAAVILAGADARAVQPPRVATSSECERELVVTVELDGETVRDAMIVYESNGRVAVPVCALAEAVSLAITCVEKRAFGFVTRETRPFVIDVEEGYAISEREVFHPREAVRYLGGDVYVDSRELALWLPMDFTLRPEQSTLQIDPRSSLPIQDLKRRQRFKAALPTSIPKELQDFTPQRRTLSLPTIDIASVLTASGRERTAMRNIWRNSLDLSGDLLYMSNEFHVLAENERVRRLDATLSRRSEERMALGPLPFTQIALGAVQAPYVDGIGASTKPMYGLYLSNRSISGSSKFLTHDIHGDLPQGWDAELFHNGTQIAYLPPMHDGMYHFVNLRVYYGINHFRVVLHGPFGERRESEEIFVSDATTPTGEVFYTLSAGWQTGLSRGDDNIGLDRESNLSMTSDFGITRNVTGSALYVRHTDFLGLRQDYVGVGVRGALRYTLLSVDVIQSFSPLAGHAGQLVTVKSSSRDIFGMNFEVVQRFFNNFSSPQFSHSADPLVTSTTVKGNSSFPFVKRVRIPYSIELGMRTRKSGELELLSEWRVSGGWNGWNTVLEVDVSRVQDTSYATAQAQVSTRLRGISIRGQAGYSFAPTTTPAVINLNADSAIGKGLQLNSGISHDPTSNISAVRVGLSKGLGAFGYSLGASGSTDGGYGFDAGLRSSVAADTARRQLLTSAEPLSPYGMVAVSAVVADADGAAEKSLPGVGYLVNGSRARVITGEKDLPVVAFLPPDIPVDLTIDMTTVEDPFMVPLNDGCRIVPRAGVVSTCKFVMTTGGEIDGMISGSSGQSRDVPIKGVRVDLLAGGRSGWKLHASTRSQESGYFLFQTVKSGTYRIVIPDAEVARLKAEPVRPLEVTMPAGGDMVSGQLFYLHPKDSAPGVSRPPAHEIFE